MRRLTSFPSLWPVRGMIGNDLNPSTRSFISWPWLASRGFWGFGGSLLGHFQLTSFHFVSLSPFSLWSINWNWSSLFLVHMKVIYLLGNFWDRLINHLLERIAERYSKIATSWWLTHVLMLSPVLLRTRTHVPDDRRLLGLIILGESRHLVLHNFDKCIHRD